MRERLEAAGINDAAVLRAMATVPRHLFLDPMFDSRAYDNEAIPLPIGDWRTPQTISHPLTVAFQTQMLQIKPTDKVLEIGTGCGYQAAVLCEMGVRLCSIERYEALHLFARRVLGALGYRPKLVFGDGFAGCPDEAPFDKIIVTCSVAAPPPALTQQLAANGRLVIPIGDARRQHLFAIDKAADGRTKETDYGRCTNFVPMREEVMSYYGAVIT